MMDTTYASPDFVHELALHYECEVRFGPAYYRATLNGHALEDRLFGAPVLWSPDSRYLVMQEWNTTDEPAGPDTTLFVVRMRGLMLDNTARYRGFIEPLRFEGSILYYERKVYGQPSASGDEADANVSSVDLDGLGWQTSLFP